MNKTELKEIIISQQKSKHDSTLVERDIFKKIGFYIKTPFVIVISGIRRVGKSTLLYQIQEKYPGYYLNFDDERLVNFKLEDCQVLYEVFIELFGEKNFFYFDEIQNIKGWERFVRRLHDEQKKVFVTGSNASMLSKELGTHLTGRYIEINLYPFSFKEFLGFKGVIAEKNDMYITKKKIRLIKYFEEYLIKGGLPEYLKTNDIEYLKTLYDSILYRDIIVRYNLSYENVLKELTYLIANNISKEISFNSIKNTLHLGSSTTVKDYFNYFENCFLIFLTRKFDYALKKQMYANKKVYLIDNGLAVNLGFRISNDLGRLLENLVFIELKRRKKEMYYYSSKKECDFIIKEGVKITEAIQVCYELHEENKEREITGLLEVMDSFKLKEGVILTYEQTEEITRKKKKIKVLPVFKWLLE
ncbi:ATP-binding protein [Candidatus Woesearchaeota archaeon]|nr:ATP-binding protein [Candidatus Woesearchaeota archaeon]